MNNQLLLSSLSNDLTRIALSIHRQSLQVAETFTQKSIQWIDKIDTSTLSPHLKKIITILSTETLNLAPDVKKQEACLTYSILLQNSALKS